MEKILAKDMVKDYTSEYGMYVATNRAIVSLVDGLKPVWRRCINSADDLKLYHNKKHLKVSKLVGQVMGDYHPHGGANPIPLAQPFKFRYPLFDGQGNYGSPDLPNSYAADRYLEIRMSKFCEDFYLDSADYADKEDNYDGRLKEITQYYPALPGCLFTGASGIAVGFSTEIPPHNIKDIGESLLKYIKNPNSNKYLEDLYPDTCEDSIVLTPLEEIREIYTTGKGSIKYRATTHYESIEGMSALVVDTFPPGFSKKRLDTPSIMDAVDKGLLEVSNESAETIRYVFTSPDKNILESLEERLTSSVGYSMYIEHRGVIKLYKLSEIYDVFLEEKSSFIVRKYTDLTEKSMRDYEYYRVLLALKSDKNYIKDMFDKSTDIVVQELVEKFNTEESIVKRVLNASLRSLMSDNMESIKETMLSLEGTIKEYSSYVNNPLDKIIKDIKYLIKEYGKDKKRSTHISHYSSDYKKKYRGDNISISMSEQYILATEKNEISILYGSDLADINLDDYIVCPISKEYYFFYDGKGCCSVTKETLLSKGSKFNSKELRGIISVDDLSELSVIDGRGKRYKGVSWSLRKKNSYIRLSEDLDPDFRIEIQS